MMIPLLIIASILTGLCIYYYYYYYKVEKFTDPEPPVNIQDAVDGLTQLLASVGSGNIPEGNPYVEKLIDIPASTSLTLYLSSFSERTHYDNGVKTYIPEMQRWNNFKEGNKSFFVKGASDDITAVIRPDGMSLKKVSLEGIRSDELDIVDYTLKSFSVTFFIKFNAPVTGDFVIPSNCELFSISLESPNYMRLTLIDSTDTAKCKLKLDIGDDSTLLTDDILKTVLVTPTPTTITITCNISTDNLSTIPKIYIGTNAYPATATTLTHSKLTLGNSRICINKNATELDARLLAFMFFSTAFDSTVHPTLVAYLNSQNSTTPTLLNQINTSALMQLENIKSLIANNTATQGTLQEQLNECRASIPPVVRAFGHKITMDGISSVSTEDLRACSILEIKNRLTSAAVAAATTTGSTDDTTPSTRTSRQLPITASLSNVTPIAP